MLIDQIIYSSHTLNVLKFDSNFHSIDLACWKGGPRMNDEENVQKSAKVA